MGAFYSKPTSTVNNIIYDAEFTKTFLAGVDLDQYDIVSWDWSGQTGLQKCEATEQALGIVIEEGGISSGESGQILMYGEVKNPSWSFVPGLIVMVNINAPGTLHQAAAASDPISVAGVAISTDMIFFKPLFFSSVLTQNTLAAIGFANSPGFSNPFATVNDLVSSVTGSSSFNEGTGVTITHNLNSASHTTIITPTADPGAGFYYWVVKGTNADTVYTVVGCTSNFDWSIFKTT